MNCPHCISTITKEQTQKTTLGYRTFRCSACRYRFNERTGVLSEFRRRLGLEIVGEVC
jgi:putative transposase